MTYRCSIKVFLLTCFLAIFNSEIATAHGGGGAPVQGKSVKSHIESTRSPASRPGTLAHYELLKIMDQKRSPTDVAIVKCTLNGFASCRGLDIVLFDEHGHQILKANSGSEGIVGFEGLKEGQKYEAKIQTAKYKGSSVITPGGAWTLNGDRINE